jgi:hypothetical protein
MNQPLPTQTGWQSKRIKPAKKVNPIKAQQVMRTIKLWKQSFFFLLL